LFATGFGESDRLLVGDWGPLVNDWLRPTAFNLLMKLSVLLFCGDEEDAAAIVLAMSASIAAAVADEDSE
jgi:hypothetical protein